MKNIKIIFSILLFLFYHALTSANTALQNEINSCQPSSCVITLPCGEVIIDESVGLKIDNKTNLLVKGCGMNGTTLKMVRTSDSGGDNFALLELTNSRWVTFQDLKFHFEDTTDKGTFAVEVRNVKDLTFERVHFHAMEADDKPGIGHPIGLLIRGASETVYISDSRFHGSGKGLLIEDCQDCWVEGSWFGSIEITGRRPTIALAEKRGEDAVRFVNNTFNMTSSNNILTGLILSRKTDNEPGFNSQVIGNSFINIDSSSSGFDHEGLRFYGYANAIVTGNLFQCAENGGCQRGIRFANVDCGTAGSPLFGCNEMNLIANNQFVDFVDDGIDCPIKLTDLNVHAPPIRNIVRGNVFSLSNASAAGADGICGNESTNIVNNNNAFTQP